MRDVVRIYVFFFSFFLDTLFFVRRSCDHLVVVKIVFYFSYIYI